MKKLLLLLALLATSLAQAAPPKSASATYNLFKNGQRVGIVSETFTRVGTRYHIESETKGIGVYALLAKGGIKLVSDGEVTKNGLRPGHFEHHRGNDTSKLVSADFDWGKNTLTLNHDGKSESIPLQANAQDRLSIMYQFMFLPNKIKKLELYMTNGKSLERYQYILKAEEKLATPAGAMKTNHYFRQGKADDDKVNLWLGTTKRNFPVRLVIDDNDGGKLEQMLTDLSLE